MATLSPTVDARYLTTFALLGVYAGVIPVFIGLLWLPFVRAVSRRWIDFFLSLTMGLLVFLGVDALVEASGDLRAGRGRISGLLRWCCWACSAPRSSWPPWDAGAVASGASALLSRWRG